MMSKYCFVIFIFIVSCGKNVNISNQRLQSNSTLTTSSTSLQEGLLIRGKPDQIKLNSVLYRVSLYSSYNALEFVASKPLSSQVVVKFKGKVKNSEIILETIQAK
jgi:hypothetical protein